MSAVTGWPPSELEGLTATGLVNYATACLEHEAHRLLGEMQLALLPLESARGGCEIRHHLYGTARQWLDAPEETRGEDPLTDEEQANIESGIAEIERELAAQHSWYAQQIKRTGARRGGRSHEQWVGDKRLLRDVAKFLAEG